MRQQRCTMLCLSLPTSRPLFHCHLNISWWQQYFGKRHLLVFDCLVKHNVGTPSSVWASSGSTAYIYPKYISKRYPPQALSGTGTLTPASTLDPFRTMRPNEKLQETPATAVVLENQQERLRITMSKPSVVWSLTCHKKWFMLIWHSLGDYW